MNAHVKPTWDEIDEAQAAVNEQWAEVIRLRDLSDKAKAELRRRVDRREKLVNARTNAMARAQLGEKARTA